MQIELITKQDLLDLKLELLQAINGRKDGATEEAEWLKSAEVMKILKISSGTLQTLRINKTIPFTKLGGTIYYPKSDVLNLLGKSAANTLQG